MNYSAGTAALCHLPCLVQLLNHRMREAIKITQLWQENLTTQTNKQTNKKQNKKKVAH